MIPGQPALVVVAAFPGAPLSGDMTRRAGADSRAGGNGSSVSPVYELRFARGG